MRPPLLALLLVSAARESLPLNLTPKVPLGKLHSIASGDSVQVDAWVMGRRIMGKSVAFLTLGGEDVGDSSTVQAILSEKRVSFNAEHLREMAKLAAPGAKVGLRGIMEQHPRGWPLFVCHEVELRQCSPLSSFSLCSRRLSRPSWLTPPSTTKHLLPPQD